MLLTALGSASTVSAKEIVHVPPKLNGPAALLVVIHGCNTTAAEQQAANQYDPIADRENFVVLYPDNDDGAHTGSCWRWYEPSNWARGGSDVAPLAASTRAVMAQYPIDPERVYVIGMSSGALITSDLVATYPDLYTAFGLMAGGPYRGVACVGKSVGNDVPTNAQGAYEAEGANARLLPFIVLHGDKDQTIDPECGRQATEQWLRTDNLATSGSQEAPLSLTPARVETYPPAPPKPRGYPYDVEHYTDPRGCEVAQRWTIHGMDHFWSGGTDDPRYAEFTDPRGPSAAEASWAFFKRYRRSDAEVPCQEIGGSAVFSGSKRKHKRPRKCRKRKYRKHHPKRCRVRH